MSKGLRTAPGQILQRLSVCAALRSFGIGDRLHTADAAQQLADAFGRHVPSQATARAITPRLYDRAYRGHFSALAVAEDQPTTAVLDQVMAIVGS